MFSKKTPIFLFQHTLPQKLGLSHIRFLNLVLISSNERKALELGIPQTIIAQTMIVRQVGFIKFLLNYKSYNKEIKEKINDPFFYNLFYAIHEGGAKI